jgi:outer membrane biosynthesis protein TonB
MKKKVRIYQMGGAQAMQNVGNMQTGPSDDELINAAMSMIGEQNASPDDVLNAFVKNGIQPDKANQVIGLVVQHINNETELGNAQVADSDNRAELEEEEMLKQEEANRIAEEDARRKQMYQEMYADQGSANYSDDDQVAMDMLMKYGGMPNKKSFVKNVMSLTKKQMGGDSNASNSVDDKSFGRKESGLDAFVKAAQNSANNALIKKDAETMYSNLQSYFQDGGDVESGIADFDPYHNLAHYSDTFEHAMPNYETDIVQAQFGGMRPGQQRRMQRRVNRMIGQVPAAMYNSRQTMFPQGINIMTMPMMGPQGYSMPARGVYQGGPQLANIDVRKVGLFGKPKEYTITFAQEAYYNPQLRQNVIRQEEVNQEETVKEIAEEQKATETNTATTENKEVLAETAKTSNGTTSTIPVKKTDVPKKEALETSVIRDDWGRPIGDEWFGFNPETKKFENVNTVQEVIDRANKANRNNTSNSEFEYKMPSWQENVKSTFPYYGRDQDETNLNLKNAPELINDGEQDDPFGGGNPEIGWRPEKQYGGFQQGGFTDPNSGLYRFINGGNELGIPQVNGKITDDPYFENGGLIKAQTGYWKNNEWIEGMDPRNVAELTNNPKTNLSNRDNYEKAKRAGINVGEYRDGIKYEDLHKFPKMVNSGTNLPYNNPYIGNMYNPQIGAMYPPLFGGRKGFRPPGRAIEYAGSWLQQQGLPIDPRTGQPIQGIVNPQLKSIDVTKSSLLRKLPKKYTMNFTGQAPEGTGFGTFNTGFQPRKNWNTSETPTADNVPSQGPSVIGTADKNESRLKGLYRRMTEKGFSYEDENQPESILPPPNYTDEELGLNEIVDVQPESFYSEADQQEMLRNMAPNSEVLPAPNYSDAELGIDQMTDVTPEVFNTPNQQNTNMFMQTRPAQALDQFINNEQLISPEYYSEDGLLGEDIQGPLNEKYSLMEQDPMNTGMNLLSVPNDYYFNQANQNSLNRQNFDLNQMYEQDPNYYNRAPYNTPLDFNSFDYTQQVGPTAPVINLPAKSSVQKRNIAKQQEKIKNETKKEVKEKNKLVKSQTKPTQNETKPTQNKNNAPLGPGGPRTDKYEAQAQREKNERMKADRELYTLYLREYRDNNKTMSEFKKDNPAAYNRMFGNGKYQYGGHLPQAQVGVSTDEDLAKLNQSDMSVDYKVKNMYNVDFERGVNQVNRGINQGLAMFGERGDRQRRADMQNNLTADNLYGNTGIQNRGTYETNSGLFRPDEMGFTGIVRNGGFMQEGGDVYGEDEETWMSEEQIRQFLAEGGELEFI